MSLWTLLRHWMNDSIDHDAVLDHVPVGSAVNARKFAKLRAKARERHGRQFRTDAIAGRTEPPSDVLKKIQAATVKPVQNVTKIKASK